MFPWDSSAIDYFKCVTKEVENEVELDVEPANTAERYEENIRGHNYLESLIEPNVIAKFKDNINEEWKGLEQSKHLFDVWRKSNLQSNMWVNDTVSISTNPLGEEINNTPNRAPSISTPSTYTAGCFKKSIPATLSEEKRREILAKKISPATGGQGVPSPFKRNLLWPKSPQKNEIVRRRLQMPSVVTSRQFQEYEEKKELEKLKRS